MTSNVFPRLLLRGSQTGSLIAALSACLPGSGTGQAFLPLEDTGAFATCP